MGIKILKNGSGEFCRVWYGRLSRNGRKVDRSLDVDIRGTIPTTDSGQWDRNGKGDAEFEESKREALRAFRKLTRGQGNMRQEIRQHETALLALTGHDDRKTPLASLAEKWCAMQRDRQPTKQRVDAAKATFKGFAAFADTFANAHGHSCTNLEDITPEMAKAYFSKLTGSLAWGTVKDKYGLMRNAWRRWAKAAGRTNPFAEIVMRRGKNSSGRISRVPLTAEEARRLFSIVEAKRPALYPLLACAATTGLRLGDACALKWSDVHLAPKKERRQGNYGTIGAERGEEVRTLKTGAKVIVPILQPFASVLEDMEKRRDDRDVYLFPDMLKRYKGAGTRSGLVREIKPFFALAVDPDAAKKADAAEAAEIGADGATDGPTPEKIIEAIRASNFSDKRRARLETVARAHFAGIASHFIAEDLGLARSQVSECLRDVEELTGAHLRPGSKRRRKLELKIDKRSLIDRTRQGGTRGAKKRTGQVRRNAASIYGWHSLRATYVVLAVEAGVPLAFIEKAVGHSTVEMTLQYFNPTGKHAAGVMGRRLAGTFAAALPDLSPVAIETPSVPAVPATLTADSILAAMSEEEKKKLRRRLLEEAGMI